MASPLQVLISASMFLSKCSMKIFQFPKRCLDGFVETSRGAFLLRTNLNIWFHCVSEPGLLRDQRPSGLTNPRKGASLGGCRVEPVGHLGRWFVQGA